MSDKILILLLTVFAMVSVGLIAWFSCKQLLPVTKFIDRISATFGVVANYTVLIACLISAGNATWRYLFNMSSNSMLEVQWYLFGAMVLLGAAHTLRVNEHVRVDLIYGMVSDRGRYWVDLLGGIVFLLPMCIILIYFTWPWFVQSWNANEASNNAGGLLRWPVKLLLPVGFGLLMFQGLAEIVKRAAALRGFHTLEYAYEKPLQ